MKQYLADMGRNPIKKSRKLMASLSAEIILLYAPLLEWLVDHGLKIKAIYRSIDYEPKQIFGWFVDKVTEARMAGDADKDKALLVDIFKSSLMAR